MHRPVSYAVGSLIANLGQRVPWPSMAHLTSGLRRRMTTMMTATLRVTTAFDDLAIPSFIGGSLAGIVYGVSVYDGGTPR